MKKTLSASSIIENVKKLNGFKTKREVAEFFGVGPSAVTDWTNRKGDKIPAKRLAEASHCHKLRWQWLAYGEIPPYEDQHIVEQTGLPLTPNELELLEHIKKSKAFKEAVERLGTLGDRELKLISQLASSITTPQSPPQKDTECEPYIRRSTSFPLTRPQ